MNPGPTEYETRALIVWPRHWILVSLTVHLAQLYTMQVRPWLRKSATSLRDHALADGYQTFRVTYRLQLYTHTRYLSNRGVGKMVLPKAGNHPMTDKHFISHMGLILQYT